MHGGFNFPNLWVQLFIGTIIGAASNFLVDEKSTWKLRAVVHIGASLAFAAIFASIAGGGNGFLWYAIPAWPFAFVLVVAASWLTEILRNWLENYLDS